jgi:hypothetical protein
MAGFLVTSTADSGAGSLRDTIAQANALAGADTILFDTAGVFALPQTITLLTGELRISGDLTIIGTGADRLTVSGNNASRVFLITSFSTVTLDGLTITGGNGVGAVSQGGGGILNYNSTVKVSNSTISGNSTSLYGGGILNYNSTVKVSNSTISGNSAAFYGGGIYKAPGGALTLSNCTITGNRAGVSSGGIFSYAETLNNTIVAGNFQGTGSTSADIFGTIGTANNNLIGDAATSGGIVNGVNGNIVAVGGAGTIDINTVLDTTLANNGGPTKTHKLVADSPAINAGSNVLALDPDANPLTTDQRGAGFPRIVGGTVDIGAFELDTVPPDVTINQAAGQVDPTSATPINFTAVFSEPVTDFTDSDVVLGGTAGATTVVVTEIAPNNGTTYNVAVSGMVDCSDGDTVIASIPASMAIDAAGNGNTASTSTDNTVTWQVNCTECTRGDLPAMSCPASKTVGATSPSGAVVNYTAPVCLDCDCDHATPTQTAGLASGSIFPIGTTVNTYQVADGGQTNSCSFSVTVVECPLGGGYWKNNPSVWPVTTLTLGTVSYTQSELLTILNTPIGTGKNADASLILADQLIAARLGIARGSDAAPISATIATANALLGSFNGKLPYEVKASSGIGQQMITLAALLDQYNQGLLTTGCTP